MKKFTFIWFIENYSYNWHNKLEVLESPTFFVEIMRETSWKLLLYPRGTENANFITLYVERCGEDMGQDGFPLNCELSILDAKGRALALEEIKKDRCLYGDALGFTEFFERPHYILKDAVITPDVLRVCCSMSIDEGEVDGETVCYAKTRIGLEKISFIHAIEHFSTRNPNQENAHTTFVSNDRLVISRTVFIGNDPASEDEVVVEISLHSKSAHLITCRIYLLNSTGKEVECGRIDTRNDAGRVSILRTPINFGRRDLLDKKREYLPNDKLTLRCECMLSTCIESQRIEDTFHDLHLTPLLKEKIHDTKFTLPTPDPKSASGDLRKLYKDPILSDIQLVTASKTFPAHKSVLCARSPVFSRRLRTNNVIEKWEDCIKIEDLDDSTIDQFLHFLYTDTLEDLQWESAMKLYCAAKEYQVQRLKDVCTSFLITQLNRRNMKDVLILADTHKDSDLKTAVQNFIDKRDLEIFDTDEFKKIGKTHCKLAAKALHSYLKSKNK